MPGPVVLEKHNQRDKKTGLIISIIVLMQTYQAVLEKKRTPNEATAVEDCLDSTMSGKEK